MITIHVATADPYFYKRVIDDFDLMPKKRGRPRESVYFEGDKKLALRLSHLIFLGICAFFDVKKGKISRKTLEKAREIYGDDPNLSRLIRGSFKSFDLGK